MALIKCPECGHEVSDKADKCPNCGCPVSEMEIESKPESQEPNVPLAETKEEQTVQSDSDEAQEIKLDEEEPLDASKVLGRIFLIVFIVVGIISIIIIPAVKSGKWPKEAAAIKKPTETVCPGQWNTVEKVDATCKTGGYEKKVCNLCGETKELSYNALGHISYGGSPTSVYYYPTCSEPGKGFYTCSRCGTKYLSEIPTVEHEYIDNVCKWCGKYEKELYLTVKKTLKSNYYYFDGTIKNFGSKTVEFVKVKIEFLDSSGNVIDTEWTYAVGTEGLSHNSSATWRIMYEKAKANFSKYRVSIMDFDYA